MVVRMTEAILFDLDGTLWDSSEEVLTAWNISLKQCPNCCKKEIKQEELNGCFGLPMNEIAKKLFSDHTEEEQKQYMDLCIEEEQKYLHEHGAKLFPELEKTLAELKKRYKLFVVSNCQSGYIEVFMEAHGLKQYFDDIECWGNNHLPKGENNKLIMSRNNITRAIYVGDTTGDEESARVAGIPFVYASYGFGDTINPDYRINKISDLPKLMEIIDNSWNH